MLLLIKLVQKLVAALNSEGTPFQVAAGVAMGACLGLTPIGSLHNALVFLVALVLNLSLAGFWLGWALFVPVGFLLDPLFDRIGHALLGNEALRPLWTALGNAPIVPFTGFNNTVVLGSLVFWLLAFVPILLLSRWAVRKYRVAVFERLRRWRVFQVVRASKLYKVYAIFRPE